MSDYRFKERESIEEPSYRSAISFDFPLKSKNKFSIENSFHISINAQEDKESLINDKESGSRNIINIKDTKEDSNMRKKVNLIYNNFFYKNQFHHI